MVFTSLIDVNDLVKSYESRGIDDTSPAPSMMPSIWYKLWRDGVRDSSQYPFLNDLRDMKVTWNEVLRNPDMVS